VILARVIGTVTSTIKHPDYVGHRLLVVQPIAADGGASGESLLAVDVAQAGVGDRVLVMREGNGVRQILGKSTLPIRSLIVGVVDEVHSG
jgi:microcompartment protein CcmK/EutM